MDSVFCSLLLSVSLAQTVYLNWELKLQSQNQQQSLACDLISLVCTYLPQTGQWWTRKECILQPGSESYGEEWEGTEIRWYLVVAEKDICFYYFLKYDSYTRTHTFTHIHKHAKTHKHTSERFMYSTEITG